MRFPISILPASAICVLAALASTAFGEPVSQNSSSRQTPAQIVLKLDDLKATKAGGVAPQWDRVLEILKKRGIKASFGLICNSLEQNAPKFDAWVKAAHDTGLIEIWFHGYAHDVRQENGVDTGEFVGRSYEEQQKRFDDSIRLAKDKLGFTLTTFGPPGGGKTGGSDDATIQVMQKTPDMRVWLYPKPMDAAAEQLMASGKVVVLDRVWRVNIEQPLFKPNAEKLSEGYEKYPARTYFVMQGHPAHWDDAGFAEFEKMLDYLTQQNAVFVTPMECADKVAKSTPAEAKP